MAHKPLQEPIEVRKARRDMAEFWAKHRHRLKKRYIWFIEEAWFRAFRVDARTQLRRVIEEAYELATPMIK